MVDRSEKLRVPGLIKDVNTQLRDREGERDDNLHDST